MGRLRSRVPGVELLLLAYACAGCGGGFFITPPPPPRPDFSLNLSANSISVSEGGTSTAVNVSINPRDGFTGNVQVTLSGLPAGVTSSPASPFNVGAGASISVVFGATLNATTGNFMISAQGSSGALSHSQTFGLTVQTGVVSTLPRTGYVRTDSVATADAPFGEPHHRHIAYDPANKRVFVANRAMNRVEVFSTSSQTRIAQISVPGATSADLSADGATVWIGTARNEIAAVDPVSLTAKNRYALAGITPIPNEIFDRPTEVLSLSSGKAMVRLRRPVSAEALLALWDPVSNSLSKLTSAAPAVFQNGVGVLARSGDHSKVLVAANDSSGELALFDSTGNIVVGPVTMGTGTIPWAAANSDGSFFAVVFVAGTNTQVLSVNASLQQVTAYSAANVSGVTFSRDGKELYVAETSSGASFITDLSGQSGQFIGRVPDIPIQSVASSIEEADETQLLFALSNRGFSFIDASTPGTISLARPIVAAAPSLQPSEGPIAGGTSTTLSGQNFAGPVQARFGPQLATNSTVSSSSQIQITSPFSVVSGAVNLTAYFQDSWLALAPDAFSYGPQILQVLPNGGASSGGDSVEIYGYGFGTDPTTTSVKIGGAAATVQKVESVATVAPSLALDSSYPFPIERITLQTPSGSPGKADIFLEALAGTTSSSKSFQYLQSVQSYPKAASFKFLTYDQPRQRIYLSNVDRVDVFDLQQDLFLTPILPPGGTSIFDDFRGLGLTPDGSQLVVADFGEQKVYLFDPVQGTGTTVFAGGIAGLTNSGPVGVAPTSVQTVFVGFSGEGGSLGACSTCLAQMNLAVSPPTIQPALQPEVTSLTGAPLLQSSAGGDQVFLAFASAPGSPLASWNANAPSHFLTSAANSSAIDLTTSADGSAFALAANGTTEVHSPNFTVSSIPAFPELTQIPGRISVPGMVLHPSGALLYQPFLTGAPGSPGVKGGVDILDAHSGVLRLRIFLPQQFMTDVDGLHGSFLATDENGQRLFAITSSDGTPQNAALTVVQLAAVPLGIGTIQPSSVSAAGGATLTVRGCGFVSGVTIAINGKAATVTLKDMNTLSVTVPALTSGPQRIMITNPDGESVSLDAAITAN